MDIPNEYKNLSAIAKASGTRLNNWVDRSVGKKAIADFRLKYPEIEHPLVTKKGRGGGTWGHPELAAIFAAWCNPGFTAEVIEQNIRLKEQNALLKEKIRTFQVNTPEQIDSVQDEAADVKKLAYASEEVTAESLTLLAKCHFALNIGANPEGITFKQYFPHWLFSMRERTDECIKDLYQPAILDTLIAQVGQPVPYQGKVLRVGCAGVWV